MKHFGKNISPACAYCRHGNLTRDKRMVLCLKKGIVFREYACKHFQYDPLRREPRAKPALPEAKPADFALR